VHAPDLGSVLQAAPHVTERRLLNKKEEEEEEEVHEITATDKNNSDFVLHTKSYIFSEFKLLDKHEILRQFR
jgi:hypothetical protein